MRPLRNLEIPPGMYTIQGGAGRLFFQRTPGNKFQFQIADTGGTNRLDIITVATYTAGATWLHLLASWQMNTAGARHLYVNDVSDLSVTTFTDATLDYTVADWAVGALASGTGKFNGCMAEVFFHTSYLDLSVEANRRLFISGGKPVNLGLDGSVPLGVQPLVYHHLDDGEAVANFATNRGSGGNFTITGTLDTGSTSPSD